MHCVYFLLLLTQVDFFLTYFLPVLLSIPF